MPWKLKAPPSPTPTLLSHRLPASSPPPPPLPYSIPSLSNKSTRSGRLDTGETCAIISIVLLVLGVVLYRAYIRRKKARIAKRNANTAVTDLKKQDTYTNTPIASLQSVYTTKEFWTPSTKSARTMSMSNKYMSGFKSWYSSSSTMAVNGNGNSNSNSNSNTSSNSTPARKERSWWRRKSDTTTQSSHGTIPSSLSPARKEKTWLCFCSHKHTCKPTSSPDSSSKQNPLQRPAPIAAKVPGTGPSLPSSLQEVNRYDIYCSQCLDMTPGFVFGSENLEASEREEKERIAAKALGNDPSPTSPRPVNLYDMYGIDCPKQTPRITGRQSFEEWEREEMVWSAVGRGQRGRAPMQSGVDSQQADLLNGVNAQELKDALTRLRAADRAKGGSGVDRKYWVYNLCH